MEKVDAESVELDEEGDKVEAAEKRILKEEVWREMFLTSDGRDKAFASSFAILRLRYAYSNLETDTIFHPRVSPVPQLFHKQSTSAPTNASAMGVEYRSTATIDCFWTIFYKVGFNICIPFVLTSDIGSCSCSLTGYGR